MTDGAAHTRAHTHRVKDISSILLLRVSWTIMFPNYLLCNYAISVCGSSFSAFVGTLHMLQCHCGPRRRKGAWWSHSPLTSGEPVFVEVEERGRGWERHAYSVCSCNHAGLENFSGNDDLRSHYLPNQKKQTTRTNLASARNACKVMLGLSLA